MRGHGHVDGRIAGEVHAAADGIVVGPVRLQIDVIAVRSVDDVVVGLAPLADEACTFEAHMHVPRDKLGPARDVWLENALITICVCQLYDVSGAALWITGGDLLPLEPSLLEDADRAQHHE